MIFLGTTFLSGKNSLYPAPDIQKNITSISLSDGTYNQLFVSKDTNLTVNNWNDEWNFDTIMNAPFDDNLDAGNSGFSLRNTDHIVIRKRELNSNKWITVCAKKINVIDDFKINTLDRYCRAKTDYIWRISSYVNNVENSYFEVRTYSDFDGIYVVDKDSTYGTIYDIDGCDTTQNIKSEIIETYNKYPTVVSNSDTNYEQGSVTGSYISVNDDCTADQQNGRIYRQDVKSRLSSKKPFILKVPDGRLWMARCIHSFSDVQKEHPALRQITFDWVEIGESDDMETLYYNGLTDVESRWWYT